jgi:hypothetical protein
MSKSMTFCLLVLGVAGGLSVVSADAATRAHVDCRLEHNAGLPACRHAAQVPMVPDVAQTGAIGAQPELVQPNAPVKLDCDSVPQNMLEYYCNHRDQFPR